MPKERPRRVVAMYSMQWYDWEWNELPSPVALQTAHEMVSAVEAWNRQAQREARNPDLVITDTSLPTHLSLEVKYVEV